DGGGPQLRHGPRRDPLRPLRLSPRPRLPRRPAADAAAALRQQRVAGLRGRGRPRHPGRPGGRLMARALPAVVYHMAEVENWPSIQRHGLLSASALLDLAGLKGADRVPHESHKRPGHSLLPGGILLRDQNPMPPDALARVLVGMTPTEWYRLMNARVFFCLDLVRLNGLRRACGDRPQVILCLDSSRLVRRPAGRVTLSPSNAGYPR